MAINVEILCTTLLFFSLRTVYGLIQIAPNIPLECPTGWTLYDVYCYRMYTHTAIWPNARSICQGEGAELVHIRDSQDNSDVGAMATANGLESFWIGMITPGYQNTSFQQTLTSKSFGLYNGSSTAWWQAYWSDGTEATLFESFWDNSQPNLTAGECVFIARKDDGTYKWSLESCEHKRAFVCQRQACSQGNFHCFDGSCINQKWVCDGRENCPDGSDELICSNNCKYYHLSPRGTIQTPNYPFDYPDSTDCSWILQGPLGSNIKLEFSDFNTEEKDDEVLIFVGGKTTGSSTFVTRLSGDLKGSTATYTSFNNYLVIKFTSDLGQQGRGFRANWSAVIAPETSSVLFATSAYQELTSPFYPSHNLHGQDIFWIIDPTHLRKIITIQARDIDLNEGDMVIIRDGKHVHRPVIGTYTSQGGPKYVISTCSLHITYRTRAKYHSHFKRGFKLAYKEGCDVILSEETGTIFSPGYGIVNYENYQNCSWTINLSIPKRITVIFDADFDLEDGQDFLQLYQGTNSSGVKLHTGLGFTGKVVPVPLSSQTGQMFINLRTDSIQSRRGYHARYSIGCPDPMFNANTVLSEVIAHYDFGVRFNVTCQSGYKFMAEEFMQRDGSSRDYVTMECHFGGVWNIRRIPQCSPVYCGQPPTIANGYISKSTGVVYTSTVSYRCRDGFVLQGSGIISCDSNASWESPPQCISTNCPAPLNITNGSYRITEGSGSDFSSSVIYSCDSGFQIEGAAILFCSSNGSWSATTPTCSRLQCYVPKPDHGQYVKQSSTVVSNTLVDYEDIVRLTCSTGYEATGNAVLSCNAQQVLQTQGGSQLAFCIDIDECQRGHGCNVTTEKCSNTDGSYSCDCVNGFYKNSTTGQCEDIDECSNNNGGCDGDCTNLLGSYFCDCTSMNGYTLYASNGTENLFVPSTETGLRFQDKYYIGHTCVRVSCPIPPTVQNGFILNSQHFYHYGDVISYRCNHGYSISGNSILRCLSTGLWDYAYPVCTAATCPQDDPSMMNNLINSPTLSSSSPIPFGSSLDLYCNVAGRGTFTKRRICTFDFDTRQYILQGDLYECGVIDCGPPEALPGSVTTYTLNQTNYYGSEFTLNCDSFYTLHGNSSQGDNIVRCGANGYWDYGNLRCLSSRCPALRDPLGGKQIGSRFGLGSTRTFECDRPGYILSHNYILECVTSNDNLSLIWNGTVPSCSDRTPPVISGCPSSNQTVLLYSMAWSGHVTASDNSGGLASFTVSPSGFKPSDPILRNVSVVYTAIDHAGNQAQCSVFIRLKDEEPPTIQCPKSYVVYLNSETESYNITISGSQFVTSDNNYINSISVSPSQIPVSLETLDNVFVITGKVVDVEGNSATCQYQIVIKAVTCLPISLNSPVNGNLTCSLKVNSTGYECQAVCDPDYFFYDRYPNEVFLTDCDHGGNWTSPYIPSCISSLPTIYKQVQRLLYRSDNANTLSNSCITTYQNVVAGLHTTVSNSLTSLCRSKGESVQKTVTVSSSLAEVDVNSTWFNVDYTLTFAPNDLQESDLCVIAVRSAFHQLTFDISALKNLTGISGCPDVSADFNMTYLDRQECPSDVSLKTRIISRRTVCLECSPGSFFNNVSKTCEFCPLGTYNYLQGATVCTLCPPGTSTYTTGNTEGGQCFTMCMRGQFNSPGGMPPCEECSGNSYRTSPSQCTSCPANKRYTDVNTCRTGSCTYTKVDNSQNLGVGTAYSGSVEECRQYCENIVNTTFLECVGFSYKKTMGICYCHYEEGASIVSNQEFDYYSRSCPDLPLEECHCYQECAAGYVSYDGFQPCRQCPRHYYSSSPRSKTCTECPQGTITLAEGSNALSNCLQAETLLCQAGRCQNNGTCSITGHDYVCNCAPGYTGRDCESTIDFCESQPCYYGATCVNLPTEFLCRCPAGISGKRCEVEPDNCTPSLCRNGGVCQDLVLNYSCTCLPGYQGKNCELSSSICSQQPCQNGATCISIDNVRRICQCPPGFEGRDCQTNINECASSPCLNGGTCIDSVNNFICQCHSQYTGYTCNSLVHSCAALNCSSGNGCYEDYITGRAFCVCQPGYTLATSCMYRDLPNHEPSGSYNNNYLNMELANCITLCNGYMSGQERCEAFTYRADRSCRIYTSSTMGSLVPSPGVTFYQRSCFPVYDDFFTMRFNMDDPVSNKIENETRQLIMMNNLDVCGSTEPLLSHCTTADSNTDYTSTGDVLRTNCTTDGLVCYSLDQTLGRDCQDYRVAFKCAISRVYSGQTCQLIDYCTMYSPCERGGTCHNVEGGYRCTCPPGYGGSTCQHDVDNCLSHPCKNGGTCTDRWNAFSCQCLPGFDGPDCSTDKNECLTNPCDPKGTELCNNTFGSYHCQCLPGYTGALCSTDVDDCLNKPCYHGGTCTDRINGYNCSCTAGWTGDRCQTLVQYCTEVDNPCRNSAECKNLFNDFYCRCPTSTYGRVCDSLPDLCQRVNPCLNQGTCSVHSGSNTTCTCSSDYFGPGCQFVKDYKCSNNYCNNHGDCHVIGGGGKHQCSCHLGYAGPQCETNIDDCNLSTCSPTSLCIDGINKHFCRCPVGKKHPLCFQDINRNYDLCFMRSFHSSSYSALPYGVPVNKDEFSLSFWVRFNKHDGKGTYFTIYEQSYAGWSSGRQDLFTFNAGGVHINNGSTTSFHPFLYLKVNDGHWHLLTLNWRSQTGELTVVLDTIKEIDIQGYKTGLSLNKSYWIMLGSNQWSEAFEGCLSQINMYGRNLDFIREIPEIYLYPFLTKHYGDLLQWAEFDLFGNVRKVQPSSVKSFNYTQDSGFAKPNVKFCPNNLYTPAVYTWNDPVFEGATSIRTNRRKGDGFSQGRHTVVYEARDSMNSTTLCHFKVYNSKDNCSGLSPPVGGGDQTCYSQGSPFAACHASCPATNYSLSQSAPIFYTCGPMGMWHGHDDDDCPFQYPPCGVITKEANIDVRIKLKYDIATTVCSQVEITMKYEVNKRLTSLNQYWNNGLCSQSDCSDIEVKVTCQSYDNISSTLDVYMDIKNIQSSLFRVNETLTPDEIMMRSILDHQEFNFEDTIPRGVPDIHRFTLNINHVCPVGQFLKNLHCVYCGQGSFYNTTTAKCELCEKGSYQGKEDGALSCTTCQTGETTQCRGATSASDCYRICDVGTYFSRVTSQCELCGVGSYQNRTGQLSCVSCPYGKTTRQKGSVSESLCYEECTSGYELSSGGVCRGCEIGYYRTVGVSTTCQACPQGFITASTASTAVGQCNVVACSPGQYRSNQNICEDCPLSTYQDEKWQTECKPCNSSYRTDLKGSTSPSQCKFFCHSGYEIQNKTCVPCPVGKYKDNNDGFYDSCKLCPARKTTPSTASPSVASCSILECPPGYKADVSNTLCEQCPVGQYQPSNNQRDCLLCPTGTSTLGNATALLSDCIEYCPSGAEKSPVGCTECGIGYYKDNNDGLFGTCQACPVNYVTPSTGSSSVSQCTVRSCIAGYKIVLDTCEPCPLGEYQSQNYQTSCLSCPSGKSTRQVAAVNLTQCEEYCPSGKEKTQNGDCQSCDRGFYKDNADGVFGNCQVCPSQYITTSTGAVSQQDCNVGNCSAGYYTKGDQCQQCAKGTYQPDKWQTSCITCPVDMTTSGLGSLDKNQCFISCQPGYENVQGKCQKCPIGYFNPTQGANCTKCPENYITDGTGAISKSQCSVSDCGPGTFLQAGSNLCQKCPYSQYQPNKWQERCIPCPTNTTTYRLGAESLAECIFDCPSGYSFDSKNNQCKQCPRGYYRDRSKLDQSSCRLCPLNYITPEGSLATSLASCSVANCSLPGQYRDPASNTCKACPLGSYQDQRWQDTCKSCNDSYTTISTGTSSVSGCIRDCASGFEESNGVCVECNQGYYRNKGQSDTCQPCPSGFTTPSTASTDQSQCTLPTCNEGQYYDSGRSQCQPCPRGSYQPAKYQETCLSCPNKKYTKQMGSSSVADCISYCGMNLDDCSADAVCTDSSSQGFTCKCLPGWTGNGTSCTHPCDIKNYCQNGGQCIRRAQDYCVCQNMYTGTRCEVRQDSRSNSAGFAETATGAAVGGSVFILVVVLVAVAICTCNRRGVKKRSKPRLSHPVSRQPSFVGPTVTKANLLDYSLSSIDPYGYGGLSLPHNNSFGYVDQLHDTSFLTAPNSHLSVSYSPEDSFYIANDKDEVF